MKISRLVKKSMTDYQGHTACVVYTGGCNLRCPFCDKPELMYGFAEEMVTEEAFFAFLKESGDALDGVVITGGEPMFQPDLCDFIRHIKGEFGLDVKLNTNGTNHQILDELLCEGLVDFISVDIKCGLEKYKLMAGDNFRGDMKENLVKNKEFLVNTFINLPYEFRTTVIGGFHSEEDFREIGELIRGAKKYCLQYYPESSREYCKEAGYYVAGPEEMNRFKEVIAPYVEEVEIREAV